MKLAVKNGDILNSECYMALHSVNCQRTMGSGVAKAIRDKFPECYELYRKFPETQNGQVLGKVAFWINPISHPNVIANCHTQEFYGYDGKRYTNYEAVYRCLEEVKRFCVLNQGKTHKGICLPYGMASVRGGASWSVIEAMINSVFEETEIPVIAYKL